MDPGTATVVRNVIWILLIVILLGYAMMWIMRASTIYWTQWMPNMERATGSSTYFGDQGTQLLIYTFPILFVACMGSVYLHLGKNLTSHGSQRVVKGVRKWKRPVLIRGPLGIVSGTELAFFTMFITLLVWSLAMNLSNSFAKTTPQSAAEDGQTVWQAKLGSTSFFFGIVGNIALTMLFFPVTRGSSVLPLLGLTSEASIKYHIWLGHITMTLFTAHGFCFIIYWISTHQADEIIKWQQTGVSNLAGEISLLAGLVLWSMTIPRVRRKMFELFFYCHYLYILFMLFFILHVGISYSCIMLPGFYLFLVDRFLRFLQSWHKVRLVSAHVLPCHTVEINFSKSPGLKYGPASTVFINVPAISKLQWHPFTVTSNSNLEQERMSVIIKKEGSWSAKLYGILSSPSPPGRLEVSVEGPYGPASTDFLRHDKLVMVSGGSGITPFISIIREFVFLSTTEPHSKRPHLLLICAFKHRSDLTMLDLLLPISGCPSLSSSSLQLHIEAYVTRENPLTDGNSQKSRKVHFTPKESDRPVSAILGPNSWLWLGFVVSASFVMFLILIGILTRYYIYPNDHHLEENFPTGARAILNVLLLCICIAVASSVAFFWNKRRNADEAMQTSDIEISREGELESLPRPSLAGDTDLHFGVRPDLKRILSGCKESSVGVLVCGPKKLRYDVASICSATSAENLHFKSISFSW